MLFRLIRPGHRAGLAQDDVRQPDPLPVLDERAADVRELPGLGEVAARCAPGPRARGSPDCLAPAWPGPGHRRGDQAGDAHPFMVPGPARRGSGHAGGLVGQVEHPELHQPGAGRRVVLAVAVLAEQRQVLLEQRVQAVGRVVPVGPGRLGPPAVLAHVPDEPVDQFQLAGDLPGPPLVQRGPVRRAEGVVVRLAMVHRERAPPAFPAAGPVRDLLDDPGVGQHPEVIAGRPGVLAQRAGDRRRGGRPVLAEVPQHLPAQRVGHGLPALGVAGHPPRRRRHDRSIAVLQRNLCRKKFAEFSLQTYREGHADGVPGPAG